MSHTVTHAVKQDSAGRGRKFVTFFLGSDEFGFEIEKVREIIGLIGITPVPQVPEYVKGVINLRGQIIPVVDLRQRFGMPEVETSRDTWSSWSVHNKLKPELW